MRRFWLAVFLVLVLTGPLPCPVSACSLCGPLFNKQTLRSELKRSKMVLFGKLANPKLGGGNGAPGVGTTELHIEKVLKSHPALVNQKMVLIPQYIPILDPKDSPKYVVFMDVVEGKLDVFGGRSSQDLEMWHYLEGIKKLDQATNAQILTFFYQHLDHADPEISGDAFLEFAKASDKDIGDVAGRLPGEKFRKLLTNPNTPAERMGLCAFLLGAKKEGKDADLLLSLIEKPSPRTANALDGLLCGYIQLHPETGWKMVYSILENPKKNFNERYAAFRVLRFYYNLDPKGFGPSVMHGFNIMLADSAIADYAIEALRRSEVWELTPTILGLWEKKGYSTPIVTRAVVRYALCCPRAEAKAFVATLNRNNPKLVEEIRESLEFEKQFNSK